MTWTIMITYPGWSIQAVHKQHWHQHCSIGHRRLYPTRHHCTLPHGLLDHCYLLPISHLQYCRVLLMTFTLVKHVVVSLCNTDLHTGVQHLQHGHSSLFQCHCEDSPLVLSQFQHSPSYQGGFDQCLGQRMLY